MALNAYETFVEPPLVFPINGKNYTLKPVDIPTGITLQKIISGSDKKLAGMAGEELWRLLLGDLWDEFVADGVPVFAATRAGVTALADFQYGRQMAEATWEAGVDPKALEKYLTENQNRASRRSRGTGAASKTPQPASTSGTRKSPKP